MSSSFTVAGTREVSDATSDYLLEGTEPLERMVLYVFQYTPVERFSSKLVAPNFKMTPE